MLRSRKAIVVLCSCGLVAAAITFIAIQRQNSEKLELNRGALKGWMQSSNSTEKLRENSDVAIPLFIKDLSARGSWLNFWARRMPVLVRQFLPDPIPEAKPEDIRIQAAYQLGCIGPAAKGAIPKLLWVIRHGDHNLQVTAAFSLGQIGDNRLPVLEALNLAAANGAKPWLQVSAELSLWQLTGATQHLNNVERLLPKAPDWSATCIARLGHEAHQLGSPLLRISETLPWGFSRMRLIDAYWKVTGDNQAPLKNLGPVQKLIPIFSWVNRVVPGGKDRMSVEVNGPHLEV